MTLPIAYCTLADAGQTLPTDAAGYWAAARSVLAAGEHIHQFTHWDVLCPMVRDMDLWVLESTYDEATLVPDMPVITQVTTGNVTVYRGTHPRYYSVEEEEASKLTKQDATHFVWDDPLRAGNRIRVPGWTAGYGFLLDTTLDIPDPVPDPLEISTTAEYPIGTMMLVGDVLCHVAFSDSSDMTLLQVPNSSGTIAANDDIMQIVMPGDLTEAAVTLAKRFAVTGNQPGAGSIGSALQPQPQAPGLRYNLNHTLYAYKRTPLL